MRWVIFCFISCYPFANSCTPEAGFAYEIENKTELNIKIETFVIDNWVGGGRPGMYEIKAKSKIKLKIDEGKALGGTDSLVVTFSDGKVKTDVLYSYRTDWVNIYNPARQIISSCGRNCSRTTYVIDEQDYAEAK
jgi:hypothetical protein